MTKVLLINQESIPHYRVTVYNRMSAYMKREGYSLTVASDGIQNGNKDAVEFDHRSMPLSTLSLTRLIRQLNPDVVIFWVRLRHLYLFPILLLTKLMGKRAIYWGHGTDLGKGPAMWLKRLGNDAEYELFDAMILYGEHLKKNVRPRFHGKTFIANNTLAFNNSGEVANKTSCLARYGISTARNIICCGRMQRRKRLDHLFAAFKQLKTPNVGLILVGPDSDGILTDVRDPHIHVLGPIYGDERFDLLAASDVFCLPGAVGLSIVDAFHSGLPLITEDGDESPEIMYLKDGVNGFVVPRGNTGELAAKLDLLLSNDGLRQQFSNAARTEINTNGHIDRMCEGFVQALDSCTKTRSTVAVVSPASGSQVRSSTR